MKHFKQSHRTARSHKALKARNSNGTLKYPLRLVVSVRTDPEQIATIHELECGHSVEASIFNLTDQNIVKRRRCKKCPKINP